MEIPFCGPTLPMVIPQSPLWGALCAAPVLALIKYIYKSTSTTCAGIPENVERATMYGSPTVPGSFPTKPTIHNKKQSHPPPPTTTATATATTSNHGFVTGR